MENCKEVNKKLLNRISRIKGQVIGIERMLSDNRDCEDIITQISAIKSSLSSLAVEILREESKECLGQKDIKYQEKSFEKLISNLFKI